MTHACYFDGLYARRHAVRLSAGDGVLRLQGAIERSYALADIALAEPFANAPAVLYFPDGARCEVEDAQGRAWLAGTLAYRKPWVVRWQERTAAALASLALLAALLGAAAVWGIPAAAERIAAGIPPETDRSLGIAMLAALEKEGTLKPSRFSPDELAKLQGLKEYVLPRQPELRLLVRDAPDIGENAFALPDGSIVLTDQIVLAALHQGRGFSDHSVAALAGILGHEAAHVRLRHTAHRLTRASLSAAASAWLFGDFSAVAAGAPALMLGLQYSREMEAAADDYAIKVMRARGLSTVPLAELFEALDDDKQQTRWLDIADNYLSTHLGLSERSERLRKADAKP